MDLDLEKFFDRVNHDLLMGRLARRVSDSRVLTLVLTLPLKRLGPPEANRPDAPRIGALLFKELGRGIPGSSVWMRTELKTSSAGSVPDEKI